jgi:HlyD family secretion protein
MKNISTLILIILLASCKSKVEKHTVKEGKIVESIYASGIVKSENQYQVYSKSSGIIENIFLKEGDLVAKNQLIISIYNENSKISKQNAQLLASFNDISNNTEKINDLKLNLDLAKQKYLNDSINLLRQEALYEKKIISKIEIEQADLLFQSSKANYNSAKNRYYDLKKQLSFSDQQSKKNLAISQNLENDFLVKSEINGKIYALLKEKGEMINPQIPLAIIGSDKNFIIELQIDEYDISKIEEGQKLIITLDSYKGLVFNGIITKVKPYLNERSKTFIAEAIFTKKPSKVYPNLSLEANIITQIKEKTITIPREFLFDEEFVIKENGDKVKVKTGLIDFEKVEIISGVKKGDILLKPIQ